MSSVPIKTAAPAVVVKLSRARATVARSARDVLKMLFSVDGRGCCRAGNARGATSIFLLKILILMRTVV